MVPPTRVRFQPPQLTLSWQAPTEQPGLDSPSLKHPPQATLNVSSWQFRSTINKPSTLSQFLPCSNRLSFHIRSQRDLPFFWDIPFMPCPSSFCLLPFSALPSLAIAFWAPFCSTNLFVCLSPGPHHSNYYSFTISLDILVVPTCNLQKCRATLSGSFPLVVTFGVIVFISTKRLTGSLRRGALNP